MGSPVVKKAQTFTSLIPPKEKKPKATEAVPMDWSQRGPTFYINGVEVPALNAKAVGSEFTAVVKCKLTSSSLSEREGGGKRRSYDLEVMAISLDGQG